MTADAKLFAMAGTAVLLLAACGTLNQTAYRHAFEECREIEDKQARERCMDQEAAVYKDKYDQFSAEQAQANRDYEQCLAEARAIGGSKDDAVGVCSRSDLLQSDMNR